MDIEIPVEKSNDAANKSTSTPIVTPQASIDNIAVIVRPVDGTWIMGEDWHISVNKDFTITDLKNHIHDNWGISPYRQLLRLKNGKLVSKAKEVWSLRRHGISNGYIIQVEPTLSNAWYWNPYSYYSNQVLTKVFDEIDKSPSKRVLMSHLVDTVFVPPPIKTSLRVFLRKYPELIHTYHDLPHDLMWIERPSYSMQLPYFSNYPVQMGDIPMFDMSSMQFDFESYADIDDTKRVELDFEIPDLVYEISLLYAEGLTTLQVDTGGDTRDSGTMIQNSLSKFPDPMAMIYFNGKHIGNSYPKYQTCNPVWKNEKFLIPVSANLDIANCNLLIELWDSSLEPDGSFINTTFLGAVELVEKGMKELFTGRKQDMKEYEIKQRKESTPFLVDQSTIEGKLVLKGGKSGYEIAVCLAEGLVAIPQPKSKPFAIVLWNKEFVAKTFIDAMFLRNPSWNESFTLPALKSGQLLTDCRLEIQIWGCQPEDEEEKCEFLGAFTIKEKELEVMLTATKPWVSLVKKDLTRSNNVPLNQRKKPVTGFLSVLGGDAGLLFRPGKIVELTVVLANRLAKVSSVFYTVNWNYMRIARSPTMVLEPSGKQMKAVCNHKYKFEIDLGLMDCSKSHLQIDLHELSLTVGGLGEFLGRIVIEKEDLMALMDQNFAVEKTYELGKDPNLEERFQRMARGEMTLRGGILGARTEIERVLIIYSAREIFPPATVVSKTTLLYVVVIWNGQLLGESKRVKYRNSALWETEYFYLPKLLVPPPPPPIIKGKPPKDAPPPPPVEPEWSLENCYLEIELWSTDNPTGHNGQDSNSPTAVMLGYMKMECPILMEMFESEEANQRFSNLEKHPKKKSSSNLLSSTAQLEIGTSGVKYTSPYQYKEELESVSNKEQQRRAKITADALAEAEREELERIRAEELELLRAQGLDVPDEPILNNAESVHEVDVIVTDKVEGLSSNDSISNINTLANGPAADSQNPIIEINGNISTKVHEDEDDQEEEEEEEEDV